MKKLSTLLNILLDETIWYTDFKYISYTWPEKCLYTPETFAFLQKHVLTAIE